MKRLPRISSYSSPLSMVHRSGDSLVVKSVVSGDCLYDTGDTGQSGHNEDNSNLNAGEDKDLNNSNEVEIGSDELPECRIKRNYTCNLCTYFTQNPRRFLYHQRDVHGERIRVFECPHCIYASKHSQKLQRHVRMVHIPGRRERAVRKYVRKNSTDESGFGTKRVRKRLKRRSSQLLDTRVSESQKVQPKVPVDFSADLEEVPEEIPIEELPIPTPVQARPKLASKFQRRFARSSKPPSRDIIDYKCSVCYFTSKSKILVHRHEQVAHLKKKFFRCNKCNYVTHVKARYTKHVKYHSMPMIKCDLCDFRTPYKWNLDRHYKNHKGDGVFKCFMCNFTAHIKQSLTVHIQNHHLPGDKKSGRRRNKVGASDEAEAAIDKEELELLRMEREEEELADSTGIADASVTGNASKEEAEDDSSSFEVSNLEVTNQEEGPSSRLRATQKKPKIKMTIKKMKSKDQLMSRRQSKDLSKDFIHPDDIIHKNGKVYIKNLKCRFCNFKAVWEAEINRHEQKNHDVKSDNEDLKVSKKVVKPIPNLIPIQTVSSTDSAKGPTILKIPNILRRESSTDQDVDMELGENDDNKTNDLPLPPSVSEIISTEEVSSIEPNIITVTSTTNTLKRKASSFFDRLKEKLSKADSPNLICNYCGHESKNLAESIRHQKLHLSAATVPISSTPSSTRCQFCRQRCKTSSGLVAHLKNCSEAQKRRGIKDTANEKSEVTTSVKIKEEPLDLTEQQINCDGQSEMDDAHLDCDEKSSIAENEPLTDSDIVLPESHPLENRVFVWNTLPISNSSDSIDCQDDGHSIRSDCTSIRSKSPSEGSLVGFETAPGIGTVSGRGRYSFNSGVQHSTMKKVFKCPECSFWATTASRFHVHIVGHLNRKPFQCSLCLYRSNWRWDITKHIKLKSARDVEHTKAKVVMTDDAGERNYDKYDIYLNTMELRQTASMTKLPESSGSGKRSRFKRSFESSSDQEVSMSPAPRRRRTRSSHSSQSDEPSLLTSHKDVPLLTRMMGHISENYYPPDHVPPPSPLYTQTSTGIYSVTPGSTTHLTNGLGNMDNGENRPRRLLKKSTKLLFNEKQDYHFQMDKPERKKFTNELSLSIPVPLPSITITPQPPATTEHRKTVWKCKKCLFRDTNKDVVLEHIQNDHYRGLPTKDTFSPPPFQCGICAQVSNWKHVIQRHCRLKHDGDIQVVENKPSEADAPEAMAEEDIPIPVLNLTTSENKQPALEPQAGLNSPALKYTLNALEFTCRVCPFYCKSSLEMMEHKAKHKEMPDALFKCTLCAYFTNQKKDWQEHMVLHGVENPREPAVDIGYPDVNNYDSIDDNTDGDHMNFTPNKRGPKGTNRKKYKCNMCPYLSDSRSQFLYHKQFHKPRGCEFECPKCSYNVSRRHLLHQHIRVHGMTTDELNTQPENNEIEMEENNKPSTSHETMTVLPLAAKSPSPDRKNDIPLVWVCKNGKFYKMFKCRDCPHVNLRKVNIQEHEKMHRNRQANINDSVLEATEQHRCLHCNYCCHNAGVLSAHIKVHQNILGEVKALVDVSKSDAVQLKEMTGSDNVEAACDSALSLSKSLSNSQKDPVQVINLNLPSNKDGDRILYFCQQCPARFFYEKELTIHHKFHGIRLAFRCEMCTYAARQKPHLLAHIKVHTREYQERTTALLRQYEPSKHYPQPKVFAVQSTAVHGPLAVPPPFAPQKMGITMVKEATPVKETKPASVKPYACKDCPARFIKYVALQYHSSLHGGPAPFKCSTCSYAVKTYGNLVRHEILHGVIRPKVKGKNSTPTKTISTNSVPISGIELLEQKIAVQQKAQLEIHVPVPPVIIPNYLSSELARIGNPLFIYPKCMKNGKIKEKRYKCQKCPSAFEKYEQYKVHSALHGSKQRFRCEKCDYSVTYYANYIQHMKKHQWSEKQQLGMATEAMNFGIMQTQPTDYSMLPRVQTVEVPPALLSVQRTFGLPELTMAEKQQLLLHHAQPEYLKEEDRKVIFNCDFCPYTNLRRDAVDSHILRHNNDKGHTNVCPYCDYAVPQSHFLREHIKIHFRPVKFLKPATYVKMDKLELWTEEEAEGERNMIFQDLLQHKMKAKETGKGLETDESVLYLDLATGEPIMEKPILEMKADEVATHSDDETKMKCENNIEENGVISDNEEDVNMCKDEVNSDEIIPEMCAKMDLESAV